MRSKVSCRILPILVAAFLAAHAHAAEETPVGAAGAARTVVLDTVGFWRVHSTLKPPVIRQPGGALKAVLLDQRWLNWETPEPPPDWTAVEFDDAAWARTTARGGSRSAYLARLCLRGSFTVTDPAKVNGLRVSLACHGGAVVYLNGKEIARGHVASRDGGAAAHLADDYPEEVFVTAEGGYLAAAGAYLGGRPSGKPTEESERRMALRERKLDNVAVPGELLRRGRNVLAVEIVRAPYGEVFDRIPKDKQAYPYEFTWNTCDLLWVQMAADGAAGFVSSAVRPAGLQVWNSGAMAGDFETDYANPAEPLRPVRIVGALGGAFSGKVVVGSSTPIRRLRAAAGDLRGPGGVIPASAVRVRYGDAWGSEALTDGTYHRQLYPRAAYQPATFGRLLESPAEECPVRTPRHYGSDKSIPKAPEPVFGAVVPVWLTVAVPRDAGAGTYTGRVTLSAEGLEPVAVPARLTVADWTLPEPRDRRTWVELIQSPDTLALEYGAPLWSEKHWQLIARSMRYMAEVGSGVVYVPLLAHANLGNAESMVRWVRKVEDRYEYDFSVMDRYLDTAEKHMGKPKIVVFNVWDVYLVPKRDGKKSRMVKYMEGKNQDYGLGPLVTVLDPATGKTEDVRLPAYFDPRSKAQWAPLMAQVAERMKRRGLQDAMMLGMFTDAQATKEEMELFAELAPGVPWVTQGHGGYRPDQLVHGVGKIGYQASVWLTRFADGVHTHGKTWTEESLHGWNQEQLTVAFERNTGLDVFPLTRWRQMGETNITGGQRGMGRLGADFWRVIKDARGQRVGRIYERFPESLWMNLNIPNALLAPGPDGPVATTRFEALREGVQECEARIQIERALIDDATRARLGPDLADRCETLLEERMNVMWKSLSSLQVTGPGWANATGWRWIQGVAGHNWFLGSDWQKRSEELYSLAGEVAKKLKTP